jgi:hypothetical protein
MILLWNIYLWPACPIMHLYGFPGEKIRMLMQMLKPILSYFFFGCLIHISSELLLKKDPQTP